MSESWAALRLPFTLGLAAIVCELVRGGEPASGSLSPQDELRSFRFADVHLTAELVAAEPDVVSPVAVAWDEGGRLLVAEMNDYPLGPVGGQVRILEDPNGDGQYENAVVFADQLPFPTSVLPWNGGVLVAAAPDIWFFKDTNGDGKADERRILFTGFGEGNQQLRVNGLFWGLDNWVYGANGRSDGAVRRPNDPPEKAVSLRGKDFRFRPEIAAFEALAGRSQFGSTRDDWGNRFLSWNTTPVRHVVIEERYLNRNPDAAITESVQDLLPPGDNNEVFPLTPRPLIFNEESSSHFNALAGLSIYRGDALGRDPSGHQYVGNAFTGESLRNLVHRRILSPQGTTFVGHRGEHGKEFLASTDPWFHPVNFTTGPDGALYVVDFYRRFVEHPDYVHDKSVVPQVPWREGAGHGRIWRVRRKESGPGPTPSAVRNKLRGADINQLVESLTHPNGWWRDTAQRLIVERQNVAAVPLLQKLARDGVNHLAAVHALWTLQGLQALDNRTLLAALNSSEMGVRETAVGLAAPRLGTQPELFNAVVGAAADATPRVRLRVGLALSEIPDVEPLIKQKLLGLRKVLRLDGLDVWLSRAVLCSIGSQGWPLFLDLLREDERWLTPADEASALFIQKLAQSIAAQGHTLHLKQALEWLLQRQVETVETARLIFLSGFADGLAPRHRMLREWSAHPPRFFEGEKVELMPLTQAAAKYASSAAAPLFVRLACVRILGESNVALAGATLQELLSPDAPSEVQTAAARALVRQNNSGMAAQVFSGWKNYSRNSRQALVNAGVGSDLFANALLDALERKDISVIELSASARQSLLKNSNPELRRRAEAHLKTDSGDREALVREFRAALGLPANRTHGAEIFERTCRSCHAVRGEGTNVGPDLSAVGTRSKETLMVDILDPNRAVSPDYLSYTLETTDDQTLSGIIVNETSAHVTLRRAQQPDETLPRSRIKELRADGRSLMPDGLELGLSHQDFADLLAFLRNPEAR